MSRDGMTKNIVSEDYGVALYFGSAKEDPTTTVYELECTSLRNVQFTLIFDGSENHKVIKTDSLGRDSTVSAGKTKLTPSVAPFCRRILGSALTENFRAIKNRKDIILSGAKTRFTSVVAPFSRRVIGRAVVLDKKRMTWTYPRVSYSSFTEDPDEAELKKYMRKVEALIAKDLAIAKKLHFPRPVEDPTHAGVKHICITHGKLFMDKDFPPCSSSVFGKHVPEDGAKAIEWRRPAQFFKGGTCALFKDGIAAEDIHQGALGDCWFMCSLAALTEFPQMIEALFPAEARGGSRCGVHTVRFCKNGHWIDIRIDDYFPCYPTAGPMYSKANGNELWVLLVEKAFAKMHGSYYAIRGGWALEALMDLTGAPCLSIRFADASTQQKVSNGELWSSLVRYDQENYLMSASTPGKDTSSEGVRNKPSTGLVGGHAYTLIAAKVSSKGHRLVKLRNPWGSMEWTGDWSDSSPLWTKEMQKEMAMAKADDGTFWMSFEDMMKHFVSLNVCMTRLQGLNAHPWIEARRSFCFEYVSADDRIVCPLYQLTLSSDTTLIAMLHQKDIRCEDAMPYIDIGLTVLQTDEHGALSFVSSTGHGMDRQRQTDELSLKAGRYLLVPVTSGSKLKHHVDSWKKASASAKVQPVALTVAHDGVTVFSDAVINAFTEVFHRMDCDSDGLLSKAELDQYTLRTQGAAIEDAAYTQMLHAFEAKDAVGISLQGFLRAELHVYQQGGANEERLRKEFHVLGYDNQLVLQSCRSVAVSVHSTAPFVLDRLPYDQHTAQEAEHLLIMQRGKVEVLEHGLVKLYTFHPGYSGISFLVENLNHIALVYEMDCSKSMNVLSHRASLVHKEVIEPKQRRVIHHLVPADGAKSWSWNNGRPHYFFSAKGTTK